MDKHTIVEDLQEAIEALETIRTIEDRLNILNLEMSQLERQVRVTISKGVNSKDPNSIEWVKKARERNQLENKWSHLRGVVVRAKKSCGEYMNSTIKALDT